MSSEISQNPPLCIPDKHHAAWAFEWKVIRHSACHRSQRRTTSTCNRCLLQHESCQTDFLGVCPSLQPSRQRAYLSPPMVRVRIWKDCGGGGGLFLGLGCIILRSQTRLLQAQHLSWVYILDVRCFGIQAPTNSRTKSGWGTISSGQTSVDPEGQPITSGLLQMT